MQKTGILAYIQTLMIGAILALLGMFVFQRNNMEQRQIDEGNQVRELGRNVDRLRGEIERMQSALRSGVIAAAPAQSASAAVVNAGSTSASSSSPTSTAVAKGESGNFLQPHDFTITQPNADMNGTLTRAYGIGQIKGFNVLTENASDLMDIWSYCGESMASRMIWTDPDKWYGQLAERVEITNNHQDFKVFLRHGVMWHHPGAIDLSDPKYSWLNKDHEFTARDVKFTFDMLMNPQVQAAPLRSYFEDLDSWKMINDYTILIHWKRPYYNSIDSTLSLPILPEFLYAYDENGQRFPDETMGLNFNQHWYNSKGIVGTGPYRMVSYTPGGDLNLERNEDYYDVRPAIKSIRYLMYDDPNLTMLKLKAHEIGFGGLRPSQYFEEILKYERDRNLTPPANSQFWNGNISHKKIPSMAFSYIGWNADKPLFKDKRVRQAMTYAFNREGILQKVYFGLGQVIASDEYFLSSYYNKSLKPYPFDLKKAADLLREAGWADTDGDGILDKDLNPTDPNPARQPFAFTLLIYGESPEWQSAASIFRDDLMKIGVKMNIDSAEWSLMQQKMDEKSFDAYSGGWGLTWDVDPYQLWYSGEADKPRSSNRCGFRNAEADKIILQLRQTFDKNERVKLLNRFQEILHEEQPYTFFRGPEGVACWWKEVKNVVFAKISPESGYSLPWYVQTRP